jgi:hypothetical protein
VRVIAVNSNDVDSHPEDSFDEMRKRSREHGFTFDYLYDEPQAVAQALGAERTPEVFVYDGDRRLGYHGAIDDNRDETGVSQQYLRDAHWTPCSQEATRPWPRRRLSAAR